MACHVYFWKTESIKSKSFGHISMQTGKGIYISFWPEQVTSRTEYLKGVESSCWRPSLEVEIEKYKRPDFTITVLDMDSDAIKQWLDDFQSQTPTWNLHSNSCSTVVYNALCAGSSEFSKKIKKYGPVTTPESVYQMIEAYNNDDKGAIVAGKAKIKN